jgi:hypothetical protein
MAPWIKISLVLSTIALCALLIADGASSYAVSKLLAIDSGSATAGKPGPPQKPPGTESPSVQTILLRNVFDPMTLFAQGSPDGSIVKVSEPSSPPLVFRKATKLANRVAVDPKEAELDAAITQRSETRYDVKRSFVDKLLGDPDALMRLARAVLHEENGQAVGVKLYAIGRTSVLGKLGLQNGDLLHSINAMSLADTDAALEALAQLRTASNLKVAITRRGQPMSLSVRVTD